MRASARRGRRLARERVERLLHRARNILREPGAGSRPLDDHGLKPLLAKKLDAAPGRGDLGRRRVAREPEEEARAAKPGGGRRRTGIERSPDRATACAARPAEPQPNRFFADRPGPRGAATQRWCESARSVKGPLTVKGSDSLSWRRRRIARAPSFGRRKTPSFTAAASPEARFFAAPETIAENFGLPRRAARSGSFSSETPSSNPAAMALSSRAKAWSTRPARASRQERL